MLVSLPGAVGFLRDDVAGLPSVSVQRAGPDYLLVRFDGPLSELAGVGTYSSLGVVLTTEPDADPAHAAARRLGELADQLATLAAGERMRFRVGASVPDRKRVIDGVHGGLGWENSPSAWDLNLEVHDRHLVAQIGAMYQTERFGPLARIPASTTPVIAEVMVRLAKVRPGDRVLDCFCGAGTILVTTVRRHPQAVPIGFDTDRRALDLARDNGIQRGARLLLACADARHLPLADLSVQRVVANLPFGKRVGSHRGNEALYPAFLREAERVLAPGGRIVLLTEDKALLRQSVQRTWRIKIVREVLLRSGGGTPTAFVVERSRRARRTG